METFSPYAEDINIHISGNIATISSPSVATASGRDSALSNSRTSKTVSIQSLMKSFKSFVSSTSSPILPTNCIKYKEAGNYIYLGLYHKSERFTATLDLRDGAPTVFENCVRPPMIMVYKLGIRGDGGYSLHETLAYAVTEESAMLVDNKTELYRPPFPNIGDAAAVCWGSTARGNSSELNSLTGLGMYCDKLFNTQFNSDLFNATLMSSLGISRPADLFKRLQTEEFFPAELLLKLHTKKTVGGI